MNIIEENGLLLKTFEEKGIIRILLALLNLSETNSKQITLYKLCKLTNLSRQTVEDKKNRLEELKFVEVKEEHYLSSIKFVPQKNILIKLTKSGADVAKKLKEISEMLRK